MTLWQIWHKKNPPEVIQRCFDAARLDYPDQRVLTPWEAEELSNIKQWVDIDTFRQVPIAQRSCTLRLGLLYEHGGLAIDADYVSLRPFEPTGDCCLFRRGDNMVSIAFMYAEPKHPLIKEALEISASRANEYIGKFPYWDWLGSHSITPAAAQHEFTEIDGKLIQPLEWSEMGAIYESDLSKINRLDECYGVMLAQSSYNLHNLKEDSLVTQLLDGKLNNGC